MLLFAAGNMNQNKIGVPEMLLHCSKCDQSSHPTCIGLSLDLIHVRISLLSPSYSHWSRHNEALLSLVDWDHGVATPSLLCHKDTAQSTHC